MTIKTGILFLLLFLLAGQAHGINAGGKELLKSNTAGAPCLSRDYQSGLDKAGKLAVAYNMPPAIKSLQPGEVSSGQTLKITGSNFGTSPREINVFIGNRAAQVRTAADTGVVVVVPSGLKPGRQKLSVTVAGARSNEAEIIVQLPPPELDSLSLSSAPPGTTLVLNGKNFSNNRQDNKVTIGGAPAEVISASSGSLTVVIPAIDSPAEAQVTVQVGKQKAGNALRMMIQSRQY